MELSLRTYPSFSFSLSVCPLSVLLSAFLCHSLLNCLSVCLFMCTSQYNIPRQEIKIALQSVIEVTFYFNLFIYTASMFEAKLHKPFVVVAMVLSPLQFSFCFFLSVCLFVYLSVCLSLSLSLTKSFFLLVRHRLPVHVFLSKFFTLFHSPLSSLVSFLWMYCVSVYL